VRVESNMQWSDSIFTSEGRFFQGNHELIASLDVEWTKNYRIKNGSRPFNYSISLIELPIDPTPVDIHPRSFGFKSVYVSTAADEINLLESLDRDLLGFLESGILMAGHQLSSDLSCVINASPVSLPNVSTLYECWRERRSEGRVIDTRYDLDHLLDIKSRRLVDVAAELGVGVEQPELKNTSMTAIHRRFLSTGNEALRERLMVLNLRHSLSTAVLAAMSLGRLTPTYVGVNSLIRDNVWDYFDYVDSTSFSELVHTERHRARAGSERRYTLP